MRNHQSFQELLCDWRKNSRLASLLILVVAVALLSSVGLGTRLLRYVRHYNISLDYQYVTIMGRFFVLCVLYMYFIGSSLSLLGLSR